MPKGPASSSAKETVTTYAYRPNIVIQGTPKFQEDTAKQLDQFLTTQTGQRWANAYETTGQSVTIKPTSVGSNAQPLPSTFPSSGADTLINFNPDKSTFYIAGNGSIQEIRPYQSMGHELIHALHFAQGSTANTVNLSGGLKTQEEADTIGIGPNGAEGITETALYGNWDSRLGWIIWVLPQKKTLMSDGKKFWRIVRSCLRRYRIRRLSLSVRSSSQRWSF